MNIQGDVMINRIELVWISNIYEQEIPNRVVTLQFDEEQFVNPEELADILQAELRAPYELPQGLTADVSRGLFSWGASGLGATIRFVLESALGGVIGNVSDRQLQGVFERLAQRDLICEMRDLSEESALARWHVAERFKTHDLGLTEQSCEQRGNITKFVYRSWDYEYTIELEDKGTGHPSVEAISRTRLSTDA